MPSPLRELLISISLSTYKYFLAACPLCVRLATSARGGQNIGQRNKLNPEAQAVRSLPRITSTKGRPYKAAARGLEDAAAGVVIWTVAYQ